MCLLNSPYRPFHCFRRLTVMVLAVATLMLQTAAAETAAIDPKNSGSDFYQGSYSLGFAFTVLSPVTVTALGFYDAGKNGLNAPHQVGIYDGSCNLLASAVVAPGDTLVGSFRYHAISPVVLGPGKYYAAAVTNNNDPYLIFVNSLEADSRLTFGGFVIHSYGGDSSLACPNGPGADPSFKGDFGPNFLISDTANTPSGATPTPTGTKRASVCKLFCNRTGVGGSNPDGLNTADCTVTVADKSGASGLIPTGTVKFTATDGFLPGAGECGLAKTTRTSSCNFQLSIPSVPPFPIGVRFPIGVEYPGDGIFGPCSEGHHLIVLTCVDGGKEDDPATCKSPSGVNTKGKPKIEANAVIHALVECGGNKATPSPAGKQELCIVDGKYSTTLALTLVGMSGENFLKLGAAITAQDISKFPALKFIRDAKSKYNAGELSLILSSLTDIEKLLKGKRTSIEVGGKSSVSQARRVGTRNRARIVTTFDVGNLKAKVPSGTIAEKTVKVPKKTRQLFAILQRLEISEIPVALEFTVKRSDIPKKKVKGEETVNFTLE